MSEEWKAGGEKSKLPKFEFGRNTLNIFEDEPLDLTTEKDADVLERARLHEMGDLLGEDVVGVRLGIGERHTDALLTAAQAQIGIRFAQGVRIRIFKLLDYNQKNSPRGPMRSGLPLGYELCHIIVNDKNTLSAFIHRDDLEKFLR